MKRVLVALAITFGILSVPVALEAADPAPEPAALEAADPTPERFAPRPEITWNGSFYTCERYGYSNRANMHCYTWGSFGNPRLYYRVVATFRNNSTGATSQRWGPTQSVDSCAGCWGPWSTVYSPYSNSSLVSLSYWITW